MGKQMSEDHTDRLHPETLRTLREFIKLHGADRLVAELKTMNARMMFEFSEINERMRRLDDRIDGCLTRLDNRDIANEKESKPCP
jgi:hypothetical protein